MNKKWILERIGDVLFSSVFGFACYLSWTENESHVIGLLSALIFLTSCIVINRNNKDYESK